MRLVAATAPLLLVLVAPAAAAGLPAPQIVQGRLTSGHPAAAALLSGPDVPRAALTCTGTLIGCRTVLTAAHCVCAGTGAHCQGGDAPDPTGWSVFFQHAGFARVERISVHPGADFPVHDLAILHLAAAVTGIEPARLAEQTPADGTTATIVGFGRPGGRSQDYGLKRDGDVTIGACGSGVDDATSVCWRFDGTGSNTCQGDSGGPLFAASGGAPVLAGVTSGGLRSDCGRGDEGHDTSVAAHRAWVELQAGDTGGGACGGLAPAGAEGATVRAFEGFLEAETPVQEHAVDVPAGTALLRVALNAGDRQQADFRLAVRAGDRPTPQAADCVATGSGRFAACEIAAPAAGTWWIAVSRVGGAGGYQATATTFAPRAAGEQPAAGCEAGRVEVLRASYGDRLRMLARVHGREGLADPSGGDLGVVLDDGRQRLALAVPAVEGRWSGARSARGVWRWRGDAGGLRAIRVRDRSWRGHWLVRIRGARVPGLRTLVRGRTRVELWLTGRCLGE